MRRLVGAVVVLTAATAAFGGTAFASETLGPPGKPDPGNTQVINFANPAPTLFFNAQAVAGVPLFAPHPGVIVRWRFYTDDVGPNTTMQLRTLVPPPGAPESGAVYTAIASGPVVPIPAATVPSPELGGLLHEFESRLPIGTGQIPAVQVTHAPSSEGGFFTPSAPVIKGWRYGCIGGTCGSAVPADGTSAASVINTVDLALGLSADIERDTDADGYGDETQDNCRGVANPTQADADADGLGDACDREASAATSTPPDTSIVAPKTGRAKPGKKASVKVSFASPSAGARFECSTDGRPFVACATPLAVRLAVGTHFLQVRAVTSTGTDPTAAVQKIVVKRIKAKKRG